jgi:hypothetical protein
MEVSYRLGVRFAGVVGWGRLGLSDEASWLSIDYARCASRVWVGPLCRLGRRRGFEEAGGGAVYRRAFGAVAPRHRDLRAHPPTDLAALVCRALRAVRGF